MIFFFSLQQGPELTQYLHWSGISLPIWPFSPHLSGDDQYVVHGSAVLDMNGLCQNEPSKKQNKTKQNGEMELEKKKMARQKVLLN